MAENGQKERWHIGKEVPIILIFTLVVQTIGVVWWAATISAEVRQVRDELQLVRSNQFTSIEARGLIAINASQNNDQDRRLSVLEQQIRELIKEGRPK